MNEIIYLEPDEEITSAIDKIRKAEADGVILVVPRGATLSQSIINLKLLKRSASELKKAIGLVSNDKITSNIAKQCGLPIFTKVEEAEKADLGQVEKSEVENNSAMKVNTYRKYDLSHLSEKAKADNEDEQEEVPASNQDGETEDEPIKAKSNDFSSAYKEDQAEDSSVDEGEDGNVDEETDEVALEPEADEKETEEEIMATKPDNFSHKKIEDDGEKKENKKHIKTEGSRKGLIFLFAIPLVLLIIVTYILVPKTTVALQLKTTLLEKNFEIAVDKNAPDNSDLIIPGTLIDLEKEFSKDAVATGVKDVGSKATGKITITNNISTAPQIVAAGAKVTATDGKIFYIQSPITVPGAKPSTENCQIVNGQAVCPTTPGTVEATVIAAANGDAYNISSTKFTVSRMTAESKDAFTGGITKELKFVQEEDIEKAEIEARDALVENAKSELLESAKAQNLIIAEKFMDSEVISMESSKKAGEEAESFNMKIKVKLFVLGFAESDLKEESVRYISEEIGANSMIANKDDQFLTYTIEEGNLDSGVLRVKVSAKAQIGNKLDTKEIIAGIKNKTNKQATEKIAKFDGIKSVNISSTPSFIKLVAFLDRNIKINYTYSQE